MIDFTLYCNDINPQWITTSKPVALHAGNIHVWLIETSNDDTLVNQLNAVLNQEELARKNRFMKLDDHLRFTFAHSLKRILTGHYLNIKPKVLIFETGKNQKPQLASGQGKLHFNFSHSHNKIVFVASTNFELGCDVEYIRPNFKFHDFMNRFYSPAEIAFINSQPTEELMREQFFRFWSRKESWLKATGIGVFNDLEKVDTGNNINSVLSENDSLLNFDSNFFLHTFRINDCWSSVANDKKILPMQFFRFDFNELKIQI